MKARFFVVGMLLLLCAACYTSTHEAWRATSQQELSAIDSLMWQQPDSAFVLLQEFAATPKADSLDVFNGHYTQLLASELLYKNYYKQSNRPDLLLAVTYFDSLTLTLNDKQHTPHRHRGLDSQSLTWDDIVFLDARAHYINGVGYYERDSVVEACKEYIKALETMEGYFQDMDLVGKKAQFMAYTYNRLGEMFSEQLLADPAIACYKQALFYCKREPTSIYGIPVLLYNLGIQFDVANQKDSAGFYYDEALANMPDHDNIHYRDVFASKALLAYNRGLCLDSVLKDLEYVISLASDNDERITRYLTLGGILFEDKQYASALFYLENVFNHQEDILSRIASAKNLCDIYRFLGDSIKAHYYNSYLAAFPMAVFEGKADASRINEMFNKHLTQKQEKEAEQEREMAVKKSMGLIIPIAVLVAMAVAIALMLRNRRLLKKQQEEADKMLGEAEQVHEKELRQWQAEAEKTLEEKEKRHKQEIEARDKRHAETIETERQTHKMQQAALSGRLKRSNQELRELKGQIEQQNERAKKSMKVPSFTEEPVCRLIMERVHEGQFKSKIDCDFYKSYALEKQHLLDLRTAADVHYSQFTLRLKKAYPKLTSIDIDYCCLYLLNLTHADVSALMQRAYNTVVERNSKIQKIFGSEKPLPVILMDIAHDSSSI